MKLIVAVVRRAKLGEVLEAPYRTEVRGLTLSSAQGHGGETEQVETYRGLTVEMDLQDKVRLEIGGSEPFVERTMHAILGSARTREVGNGKVSCFRWKRCTAFAPARRTRPRSRRSGRRRAAPEDPTQRREPPSAPQSVVGRAPRRRLARGPRCQSRPQL